MQSPRRYRVDVGRSALTYADYRIGLSNSSGEVYQVRSSCLLFKGAELMDSAFWTMYYLGAIVASWTSYGTQNHLNGDWTWRIPSIVQAGFPILQLIFFSLLPESPRYVDI